MPPSIESTGVIAAGRAVNLRDLGHDEIWLQNWLADDPERLGLGEVTVLAQELTQSRGGSLDFLATDGEAYYSIEVQLGEVDANHGFRVFDYWAQNQERYPDKAHVAVLIAESASGRYGAALKALAEYVPLIVIELRAWRGASEAVLVPQLIYKNGSLDVGAIRASGASKTEAEWKADVTPEAWQFHRDFVAAVQGQLGEVRVDYSPQSYIGVRRGRRVWAPLWMLRDGARMYLPDPDGSREEEPSIAFEYFHERLASVGIDITWSSNYNAGSNPISLALRVGDLDKPEVMELLLASFQALEAGAIAWSEQRGSKTDAAAPVSADGEKQAPTTED